MKVYRVRSKGEGEQSIKPEIYINIHTYIATATSLLNYDEKELINRRSLSISCDIYILCYAVNLLEA